MSIFLHPLLRIQMNNFTKGQKLLLARNDEQILYDTQEVTFLGLAKEPNNGTAVVITLSEELLLVRKDLLVPIAKEIA